MWVAVQDKILELSTDTGRIVQSRQCSFAGPSIALSNELDLKIVSLDQSEMISIQSKENFGNDDSWKRAQSRITRRAHSDSERAGEDQISQMLQLGDDVVVSDGEPLSIKGLTRSADTEALLFLHQARVSLSSSLCRTSCLGKTKMTLASHEMPTFSNHPSPFSKPSSPQSVYASLSLPDTKMVRFEYGTLPHLTWSPRHQCLHRPLHESCQRRAPRRGDCTATRFCWDKTARWPCTIYAPPGFSV